jgi:hypothetical protein
MIDELGVRRVPDMILAGYAVAMYGLVLGPADERADYGRLCDIWRKTEPAASQPRGEVTAAERQWLREELGGRRGGIAPHDFRRMAAITLGNLRDGAAVPGLILRLRDRDDDPMASAEAARALGKIGDLTALPHLLDALQDDRPVVRGHAADALRRLHPSGEAITPFASPERFRGLLDSLARIPPPRPGPELRTPEMTPAWKRAYWTAREVDAICVGINLVRPARRPDADDARAERLAERLLSSGFHASYYRAKDLQDLTTFCRTYQPGRYAERMKGE